jgi:hypothetical protein
MAIGIPYSVEFIRESAFAECQSLESMVLAPDSKLLRIEEKAF